MQNGFTVIRNLLVIGTWVSDFVHICEQYKESKVPVILVWFTSQLFEFVCARMGVAFVIRYICVHCRSCLKQFLSSDLDQVLVSLWCQTLRVNRNVMCVTL